MRRRSVTLFALGALASVVFAQNAATDGVGTVVPTFSQLQVLAPLNLYVSSPTDGGIVGSACTQGQPCSAIQRACDLIPAQAICDAVSVYVAADYAGTGCRMEGIHFCSHPNPDGGVTWGSLAFHAGRHAYAPADGGTGAGTVASTTAGTNCSLDQVAVTSGGYNSAELVGKLLLFSGQSKMWPIRANDAGVITLQSFGDATLPSNGTAYQVYDSSSTLNANLGQVVVKGGSAQGTNAAAFEFSGDPNTLSNGAGTDYRLLLDGFNVSGGSTVLAISNGVLSLTENYCGGNTCWRGAAGEASLAASRNISSGGIFALAANTTIGVHGPLRQLFNNLATSGTTTAYRSEDDSTLISRTNYFPNGLVRMGGCANCTSTCDTFDSIRGGAAGLTDTPGNIAGHLAGDGLTFTNNSGSTYPINLTSGFTVVLDQNQGGLTIPSSITAAGGGHGAILTLGAKFIWAPGTTFTGAGTLDICPGSTSACLTVANLRARKWKGFHLLDDTMAFETGGTPGFWEPMFVLGAPREHQSGSSTFVGTTKTVSFPTAFIVAPTRCSCNDTSGAAAACSWTGTANTTTANFIGVTNNGTFTWDCDATKE